MANEHPGQQGSADRWAIAIIAPLVVSALLVVVFAMFRLAQAIWVRAPYFIGWIVAVVALTLLIRVGLEVQHRWTHRQK